MGQVHEFLTSTLGGSEWSAPRPDRFTPEINLSVPFGFVTGEGRRVGLDAVVNRKIPAPTGNHTPVVQHIA